MTRRSTIINYLEVPSSRVSYIRDRLGNAQVSGRPDGWFKIEHDRNAAQIRVRFYAHRNHPEGSYLAESTLIPVASLPALVTLNPAGASGVSATIQIDGVRG